MNIETMAGYVSYFIFQFESLYTQRLYLKTPFEILIEGLTPLGVFQTVFLK